MYFTYPAVFHPEANGGFSISFPDVKGCYSQGETIDECKIMAADALSLMLLDFVESKSAVPAASPLEEIQKQYPHGIIEIITVNI